MRLSSKHGRILSFAYTDFTGGVNFAVPPEALSSNEAQMILNWEFDPASGVLKTRDGLEKLVTASAQIDALFYANNLGLLLVVAGGTLYKLDTGNVLTAIGNLSGTEIPVFAEWENGVLIASGENLQFTDGLTITTITSSPLCDYVTTQYGRVVVSKKGDDYLYWSGVGDETNWDFTGTLGDALRLEVGYKDGGNIVSVRAISRDLVVFKDNKRIYRVVGVPGSWSVYEITRDSGAVARMATLEVGNSVVFVDETGIRSLDTVVEYGDIKVRDIGDKINVWIRKNLDFSAVYLWHVRPKGQIWFRSQLDEFVYIFHYNQKAWTVFRFPGTVTAVAHGATDVYVALGTDLYCMDSKIFTDDGIDIEARIILSRKLPSRKFLLKLGRMIYEGVASGSASLKVGKLTKPLGLIPSGDIAYFDSDIAYSDTDPVVAVNRNEVVFRANYRLPYLEPEITVVSGSMKLLGLIFEVAEV